MALPTTCRVGCRATGRRPGSLIPEHPGFLPSVPRPFVFSLGDLLDALGHTPAAFCSFAPLLQPKDPQDVGRDGEERNKVCSKVLHPWKRERSEMVLPSLPGTKKSIAKALRPDSESAEVLEGKDSVLHA